jgi:hypothetical protein
MAHDESIYAEAPLSEEDLAECVGGAGGIKPVTTTTPPSDGPTLNINSILNSQSTAATDDDDDGQTSPQ